MKKPRLPLNPKDKKLGNALLPTEKFNGPTDDLDELEAIRAYDSARAFGETPIPYEQVLRIERSRR